MTRSAFRLVVAAQIMFLAGTTFAQPTDRKPQNPPPTPPTTTQPPQPDRVMDPAEKERMQKEWDGIKKEWDALTPEARILSVIHAKNLKEVEIGRLGQQKGTSQEVKEFAGMMVREHGDADSKLTSLASSENISIWDPARTERAMLLKKMFEKDKDGKDKDKEKNKDKKDHDPKAHPSTTNPDQPKPASPAVPGPNDRKPMKDDHDRAVKDPAEKLRGLSGEEFDNAFGRTMYYGHSELLMVLEKHGSEVTNANVKSYVNDVTSTVRSHRDAAAKLPGAKSDGKDGKPRDPNKPSTEPKEPVMKDPNWDR